MKAGEIHKALVTFNPPQQSLVSSCDITLVDAKPTLVLLWHEKKDGSARIPLITFTVEPGRLKMLRKPAINGATYVVKGVIQLSGETLAALKRVP